MSESPEVPFASFLALAMHAPLSQYVAMLQIAPDVAFIKHAYEADVSMDFHLRLEQPPMVKFYARVSFRVSFLYL